LVLIVRDADEPAVDETVSRYRDGVTGTPSIGRIVRATRG
jgi:hypothetical protein